MQVVRNRRALVIVLAAALVGVVLLAAPFSTVGMAQSNQQAAEGARLMRGAVDLHYHVDPGYGVYEHLSQAKAAGVRALLLKNHYEPTAALVMLLRPQFPGLELYAGFVFNRSNGGVNVPGVEYMASIRGEPKPGKIVWLPAGDTEKEAKGGRNPNPNAPFVTVSRNGQLAPEIKQALAVIAKNNFTLASGHVVAEEALLVFREAKAAGVGAFAAEMKKRGFSDRELEMMFKDNPAKAIGLPVATP